jgi:small subunit ribosomal protein S6
MSDEPTNIYEGLFLFPQSAAANLQAATDHLDELLQRAGVEVVSFRKWDERRLAFEVKGNKRGVYFLVYFRAAPERLVGLERDCNLSEQLLRSMITRADHIPMAEIQAAEGRAQLADEIKLRETEGAAAPAAAETPPDEEAEPDREDELDADAEEEDEDETAVAAVDGEPEAMEKPLPE